MTLSDVILLLTFCLYATAVYNCARVIGDRLSPGTTMAWIFLNLTLPFIGVPLYFLFGDFRIKGYKKRHRAAARNLEQSGPTPNHSLEPNTETLPSVLRPNVESYKTVFSSFGSVFRPQHGTVELLVDGTSTFEAIFKEIAGARRYILVQYYILRSDRLGLELKRLLMEKAQGGVPVYLLFDDMGSLWLSRQYVRDLRHAGVIVERFLPIASFKRFFQLNFRNHRKLVVVDGVAAFTGGLNVGEEYATPRKKRQRSKAMKRYWRDTHMRITGGAVESLEEIFLEDWSFATERKFDLDDVRARIPLLEPVHELGPARDEIVQVIPSGPTDDRLVAVLFLLHLINSARTRLWIATPYFVPDGTIVRALELAVLRGVEVRLILPRVSDNAVVHWVSLSYADIMQQKGVLVLLYEAGFMHQKAILVDDNLASLGTMNIDNRALYLNFETMIVVHGFAFNKRVERMLQHDFLSCRFRQLERHPFLKHFYRVRANVARLLAPLL